MDVETTREVAEQIAASNQFQLIRQLGRGANGEAYLVKRNDRSYVLKIGTQRVQEASMERHLLTEAVTHARLQNIAQLAVAGLKDGHPYMVIDYVDGRSLRDMLTKPLEERVIMKIAQDLGEILQSLHNLGVVHCDIKPENIIVSETGKTHLIDFGLTTQVGSEFGNEIARGSFGYAAPEQTRMLHRPLDGRSDLYGLGAVLYECATGQPPYIASDLATLLQMHAQQQVPDPCAKNHGLSPHIGALIQRLLAKDPDDRYNTAHELCDDLQSRTEDDKQHKASTNRTAVSKSFIGREAGLQTLEAAKEKSKTGQVIMHALLGAEGIGKSRLLDAFLSTQIEDAPVMSCVAHEERRSNLAALRNGLERLIVNLTPGMPARERLDDTIKSLLHRHSVLAKATPTLSRYAAATTEKPLSADSVPFGEALQDAIVEVCLVLGVRTISFDNAQWGDEDELACLLQIARRNQLFVIFCERADSAEQSRVVDYLKRQNVQHGSQTCGSMSKAEVAALMSDLLGGYEIDNSIVDLVASRAGGNPMIINELVAALLANMGIYFEWGRWKLDESRSQSLELRASVIDLVCSRLNSLDAKTREVLSFAALAGRTFSPDHIALAVGDSLRTNEHFLRAARALIISPDHDGRYVFVHPALQDALLADTDEAEKQRKYQRLAERATVETETFELATWYARGLQSNVVKVLEANRDAAFKAVEENAPPSQSLPFFSAAMQAAQHAQTLLPTRFLRFYAETLARDGRLDLAKVLFEQAIAEASVAFERAECRNSYVMNYLLPNLDLAACNRQTAAAMRDIGKGDPDRLGLLRGIFYLVVCWLFGNFLHGRASEKRRPRLLLETKILRTVTLVTYYQMGNAAYAQCRRWYIGIILGSQAEYAAALCQLAGIAAWIGMTKKAIATAKEAEALMKDDRTTFANNCWLLGAAYELSGENRMALNVWERGLTIYRPLVDNYNFLRLVQAYGALHMFFGNTAIARNTFENAKQTISTWSAQSERVRAARIREIDSWLSVAEASRGEFLTARAILDSNLAYYREHQEFQFGIGIYMNARAFFLLASESSDEELRQFEDNLHLLNTKNIVVYEPRFMFNYRAFVYLRRCYRTNNPVEKNAALADFDEAMRPVKKYAIKTFRNIYQARAVLEAARASLDTDLSTAIGALAKAEPFIVLQEDTNSRIQLHLARAQVFVRIGQVERAQREARHAEMVALQAEYTAFARSIQREFSLVNTQTARTFNVTSSAQAVHIKRHLDSLLSVSAASVGVTNIDAHARNVLDQMVRLLNAERAFLFLRGDDGQLVLHAARNDSQEDIPEVAGHSRTIIQQVMNEGCAIVMSGSENGGVTSESAIMHGLRSIVAAPLLLKEKLIGIVYLDSRVAKGVFDANDTEILGALANHIAIGLETSRVAGLEIERSRLTKDLEVTGAVQSLLLPERSHARTESFALAGICRSATESGGDWWAYESNPEHGLLLLVGDITGHGAGSAMMTAIVASCYRTTVRNVGIGSVERILGAINDCLCEIRGENYRMTMTAIHIPSSGQRLHLYGAGAPPVLRKREHEKIKAFMARGTPLGMGELNVGHVELDWTPSDRLAIFTDGVLELPTADGRQFGLRRFSKLFEKHGQTEPEQAIERIMTELDLARGDETQDDDITLIVLDAEKPSLTTTKVARQS